MADEAPDKKGRRESVDGRALSSLSPVLYKDANILAESLTGLHLRLISQMQSPDSPYLPASEIFQPL